MSARIIVGSIVESTVGNHRITMSGGNRGNGGKAHEIGGGGWFDTTWTPLGTNLSAQLRAVKEPLTWKEPRIVLLSVDPFEAGFDPDLRYLIFGAMAAARQHHFLIITERPHSAAVFVQDAERERLAWTMDVVILGGQDRGRRLEYWPLPHVWFGSPVRTQAEANERIPQLYSIPAAVHFSYSVPLLEKIDFRLVPDTAGNAVNGLHCLNPLSGEGGIDWVIVGGGDEPPREKWLDAVEDACSEVMVPLFFAGWGKTGQPHPEDASSSTLTLIEDARRLPDAYRHRFAEKYPEPIGGEESDVE